MSRSIDGAVCTVQQGERGRAGVDGRKRQAETEAASPSVGPNREDKGGMSWQQRSPARALAGSHPG